MIILNFSETQYPSSYGIFSFLIKLGTKIIFTLCIRNQSEIKSTQISDYLLEGHGKSQTTNNNPKKQKIRPRDQLCALLFVFQDFNPCFLRPIRNKCNYKKQKTITYGQKLYIRLFKKIRQKVQELPFHTDEVQKYKCY